MTTQQAIIQAMENILGYARYELEENLDLNLIDNGLLDSLAIVSILAEVENNIGCRIEIGKMKPEDFSTIHLLTEAINNQLYDI